MIEVHLAFDPFPTDRGNTLKSAIANNLAYQGEEVLANIVYETFENSDLVLRDGALHPLLAPSLVRELTVGIYARYLTLTPLESYLTSIARLYGEKAKAMRKLIEEDQKRGDIRMLTSEDPIEIRPPSILFFSSKRGVFTLNKMPPLVSEGQTFEGFYLGGEDLYEIDTEVNPVIGILTLERKLDTTSWVVNCISGET